MNADTTHVRQVGTLAVREKGKGWSVRFEGTNGIAHIGGGQKAGVKSHADDFRRTS